jgi:tetratricopeptide (TPR) repeat protein
MGDARAAAVDAGAQSDMSRTFFLLLAVLATTSLDLAGCSLTKRVVIPHDPLTAQEHVALGEAYQAKGLKDAAEKEFRAAIEREADYVPALVSLGNLAFENNDYQQAEDYYRHALQRQPDHPQANNNLAMVYLTRGERLAEAEQLVHNALKGAPALRPYVLDTLVGLYLKQGRLNEAAAALDEAERSVTAGPDALRERFKQLRTELTNRPSTH